MKRLALAAVVLALVVGIAAIACADDTQEKGASFHRGYLAGYDAGLSDGQEAAYQQAYREGAQDGRSDVDSVYGDVISRRINPHYVAWCNAALHCPKAVAAANAYSNPFAHASVPTADVDRLEDVDAAYAAGFDDGHQAGEVVGRSRGQFEGYSDGYTATTCASPLAKMFLMYCPQR